MQCLLISKCVLNIQTHDRLVKQNFTCIPFKTFILHKSINLINIPVLINMIEDILDNITSIPTYVCMWFTSVYDIIHDYWNLVSQMKRCVDWWNTRKGFGQVKNDVMTKRNWRRVQGLQGYTGDLHIFVPFCYN